MCVFDLPKRVAVEVCGSVISPIPSKQVRLTSLNPEYAITVRLLIIESLGRGRTSANENLLPGPPIKDIVDAQLLIFESQQQSTDEH